jgi:hypothetical protein
MDTIIFGFLVGIVVSIVSVLLMVQLTGEKLVPHKITRLPRRIQVTRVATVRKHPKSRRVKPRTVRKLRMKNHLLPVETSVETPTVVPVQSIVSSCPACGLQAPENLMIEHFMGSPSHQYGPVQPVATVEVTNIQVEADVEEDSQSSVRSLLQMLVPPRAFGRRHAHRTVSPLPRIVESTRDSGHTSFRP